MGSLIEVNYSMNTDKTDYVEDRRVYKNYVNSGVPDTSGGLSAEEIVEKVLKDLTPTVIQVVRVTVQGKIFLSVKPMQYVSNAYEEFLQGNDPLILFLHISQEVKWT